LLLFSSFTRRRWNFFVSNSSDAKFVLSEECWIEQNFVPIRKSPSCFQAHRLRAASSIKSFPLRFRSDVKTVRQPHFDLLSKQIIRRPMTESLTLKKLAKEECPWRQHVRIHCVGETA